MDVQASYEAHRQKASARGEEPELSAQKVYKLGHLGCVIDVLGKPWPCCPQYFAKKTDLVLQREADRLLTLSHLVQNCNVPLDPEKYTVREVGLVRLAMAARARLEAKHIKDSAPKPKEKPKGKTRRGRR